MTDKSEQGDDTQATDDGTQAEGASSTTGQSADAIPDGSGSNSGDDDSHDDVASGGGAG